MSPLLSHFPLFFPVKNGEKRRVLYFLKMIAAKVPPWIIFRIMESDSPPFFCRNRRKLNSYRRRERKDHDKSFDFYSLQRILRKKPVDAPNRHFLLRETEWRLDRGRKKPLVDFVQKRIVLNRLLLKDRFRWNG